MAVKYEIRAKTGEYTDKDGNQKSSYMTIGKVITTKNGDPMIKMEAIPLGWDGWGYLNPPMEKEQRQEPKKSQGGGTSRQTRNDDSDIPF